MGTEELDVWRRAFAVLERHGAEACAFATERLAFCRATSFVEGVALWSDIQAKLAVMVGQAADDRPRDEG